MFKQLAILAGLLLVVGCQHDATPSFVSPPPLTPPTIAQGHANQPSAAVARPPNQQPNLSVPTGQRAWVPSAPPRSWKWIVIHHSDTDKGSAGSFDAYHRNVRHWDELGYHFVIDNGNGAADGLVEVGSRWPKQKWGAHAGVPMYNEYGIGICLVGNFEVTHPTARQMQSLAQLTAFLMRTYHIAPDHVIGHREAKDGRTTCPGRNMNLATVRRMAASIAGIDPSLIPGHEVLASAGELMH